MRTRTQILQDRYFELEAQIKAAQILMGQVTDELAHNKVTPCPVKQCRTCKTPFVTEQDFWSHYLITDSNLPHLGECPTKFERKG